MFENRCAFVAGLSLGLVLTASPAALAQPAAKSPVRVDDLYLFDAPRSPALSPDGQRVVYVRSWIDAVTKQERHSLWVNDAEAAKARALEAGEPDARAPVVSPDGQWVVFLSTRPRPQGWRQVPTVPKASDPATDLWMISIKGGPALPLAGAEKPYGRAFHDGFYGRVAFSPDGTKLVFVADDGVDPRTAAEIANDVQIVRPDQGEGYTGYGPAQIWLADLALRVALPSGSERQALTHAAKSVTRLTNDDVWYGDPQWSPDGKTIVAHANKSKERESVRFSINRNFDIWSIDVASKKQTQWTVGPGPEVSPRWSPDGKKIACLSVPRKGSHRDVFNLAIITMDPEAARMDIVVDHHTAKEAKPPHQTPAFPLPADCWLDAETLVYNSEVGTRTEAMQLDLKTATAKPEALDHRLQRTGQRQARQARLKTLLPGGDAFLKDRLLAVSELVEWPNPENTTIQGILTIPPSSVAKPPYKLVVHPHGGPHSRSVVGFDFTVQVLAAHGYAVFQPNFRGSSGYGQKFSDADRGDFGGGDMRDILSGIDHLVKQGLVDPQRQFVYGTSYGGFMTTWLVGHTKQFRAAVAQNAVTDLAMMWGLSDLQSWVEWEFGLPWDVPEKLRKHSPLTYADKVATPTLILHARDDRRCPLPMGKAFHQALTARGVPTQMVIYPDEGHGIRQPRHREDVLRRVLAWFARHGGDGK